MAPNYNLLSSELFEYGFGLSSGESNKPFQFNNLKIDTLSLYDLNMKLGLGKGYGWNLKEDQNIFINNTFGLIYGGTSIISSQDNFSSIMDMSDYSRDYFSTNLTYSFNKKTIIQFGVSRYITYTDFKFFEGIMSKMIESGVYYAIDELLINYMANEKIDNLPIYNMLIHNSISYLIYSLKKDNDSFPFNGNKGFSGYQFQIGITFNVGRGFF